MDWNKVHLGKYRQGPISDADIARSEAAGVEPGVNPKLKAPEIATPADEPEVQLHGDVDGSPFSANPGEKTLADAAREKGKADPSADARAEADAKAKADAPKRAGGK